MRYVDALKFITVKENWFTNLLLCAVCAIIPAVGQIVLIGYLFEVFDAVRADPQRKDYPDFKFDRFVPYLTRGIWVFLVQLVVGLVLAVPIGLFAAFVMVLATAGAKSTGGGSILIAQLFIFVFSFLVGFVIAIITWPMAIYEGIRQELDIKGLMAFTRGFVSRMWKETLLCALFLMACGMVLGPLGLLACCVGVYLVAPFLQFAQHHLKAQTYLLYLERGGTPVPEKGTTVRNPPDDSVLAEAAPVEPPPAPPAHLAQAIQPEPPPPPPPQ